MPKTIDISGQRFGKLIAIKYLGKSKWECQCDCGNITAVDSYTLKNYTRSCGCLRKETASVTGKKFGSQNKIKEPGLAAKRMLYHIYKNSARKNSREFLLDFDTFIDITQLPCEYCGIEPYKSVRNGKNIEYNDFLYNGIDRIDNSKGYIKGNVVPCCETCNRAKLQMSIDEFYNWIDKVNFNRKDVGK